MNALPLVFCLCFSFAAPAPPGDRWIGEDKVRHAVASFAATAFAASGARAAGLDVRSSVWVGAGVGAGVGVWKEARDARLPGASFSLRDLTWDLGGVGAAAALMSRTR